MAAHGPTKLPTADLQHLRSELLYRTLVEHQPDLVLVDHMPGGVQGELGPASLRAPAEVAF